MKKSTHICSVIYYCDLTMKKCSIKIDKKFEQINSLRISRTVLVQFQFATFLLLLYNTWNRKRKKYAATKFNKGLFQIATILLSILYNA